MKKNKAITLKKQTGAVLAASLLFVAAALFLLPVPGHAQTRCVDYWTAGPSNCKKPNPEAAEKPARPKSQAELIEPEEPPQEEEMSEEEKKEAKLKQDIEQFYNRHGKPPEEFVRFYMDPSPANAIAWVKKYNENLQRSRQLAAAWTQAQEIYDRFEEQGMELPPELLPEHARENENALPPVQDLGVELPPGMEDAFGSGQQAPMQNHQEMSVGSLNMGGANFSVPVGDDGRIGGNLPPEALTIGPLSGGDGAAEGGTRDGDGPIQISYYFSAECPFCEKFEPGFREVLEDMGNRAEVTCVDMTPSGQDEANIRGKIDCEWRPLLEGEMQAMGVEATPTLIVDRGGDKPLERLSGFVDEGKLRRYLIGTNSN